MYRMIHWALPLALVAGFVPVAVAAQGAPKFAYVNSQAILAQAPGRAEAEAQFNKEMDGYRQELKRMQDSLNAMLQSYSQNEATLTPAQKQTQQDAIRSKQGEYQQRAQALEEKASQREAELMRPIMDQVQKVIEGIRTEDGYTMIFDASSGGPIVAADKNLDITQKVIARLQTTGKPTAQQQPGSGVQQPSPAGVSRPSPKRP
ncbi:MAG TPA: OmpH family outer membrane protein [Gemmatimonadaceae bacterium]|nr:OmpH family outer membrane protein [Gemmatimonadaceae bacterium]